MLKRNTPTAIDRRFTGIASKYEVYIVCLYVDTDAIRIRYEITPPISSNSSERRGLPTISWRGYARDDQGGDYQSAGGALGLSDSEQRTDGVLSFLPLPNEEVNCLDITMILIVDGIETKAKYEFSVSF
ncbi:MAG: hypothetical protein LH702_37480 [Phormidesmis sp. CAN_BIN44]|nr:hypothetical protein [Phormidesmis sp. CAN_BIN44]